MLPHPSGNYDLLRYWRSVGDSPSEIARSYLSSLERQVQACKGNREQLQDVATACVRVGRYLAEAGHYAEAVQPYTKVRPAG